MGTRRGFLTPLQGSRPPPGDDGGGRVPTYRGRRHARYAAGSCVGHRPVHAGGGPAVRGTGTAPWGAPPHPCLIRTDPTAPAVYPFCWGVPYGSSSSRVGVGLRYDGVLHGVGDICLLGRGTGSAARHPRLNPPPRQRQLGSRQRQPRQVSTTRRTIRKSKPVRASHMLCSIRARRRRSWQLHLSRNRLVPGQLTRRAVPRDP